MLLFRYQILRSAARLLCVFMLASLTGLARADALAVPDGRYVLDDTHAYITFSYSHLGFSTPHLGFREFSVEVELDADAPTNSTLNVGIATDSIDSRVDKFDEILKGPDFFNVSEHPDIRFVASGIAMTGANKADIAGTLTIKGISQPVTLDARIDRAAQHPMLKKPVLGVSAFTEISRSAFKLGKYAPAVGDTVSVYISAELVHQGEAAQE
ncbi:MAG: YceI family protein [Pseudomonadales bacterium]